jgi:hypothetical protein
MNPLLDQLAVTAIVAGALAFFIVRFLRKRAAGKNCGGGCGCGTSAKAGKIGR